MIKEALIMATQPLSSGGFGNLLDKLDQLGFFRYAIPFLLIFALVFGILTKIKLFKDNKAINAIIALAVSLMTLQVELVSTFFAEIFPRLGIGLGVILIILILAGLFFDFNNNALNWGLFAVGIIIVLVVLGGTAGSLGVSFWDVLKDWWPAIITAVVVIIFVIVVIGSGSNKQQKPYESLITRGLLGKDN